MDNQYQHLVNFDTFVDLLTDFILLDEYTSPWASLI